MTAKPQTKAQKRRGRCYELTLKALIEMNDPGEWRLVHGIVGCVCVDAGHAWLTDGREVFDPVHGPDLGNEFIPLDVYERLSMARRTVIYTKAEALAKLAAAKHYGSW